WRHDASLPEAYKVVDTPTAFSQATTPAGGVVGNTYDLMCSNLAMVDLQVGGFQTQEPLVTKFRAYHLWQPSCNNP
ncbi:hypothetical protein AVEN_93275-1, partial [Araneus ventricosus]